MNISVFKKAGNALVSAQRFIGVLLAFVAASLVVYQVILRYVFKAPLMGIEELLIFPTIWLYMIGGANASQQRNHIECGILTLYMKREGTIKLFNACKSLFSMIVSLWLTYWAYWFFIYSYSKWKLSDILYIPMFYGESALFIGLVFMSIYAIIDFYMDGRAFIHYFKSKAEGGNN
ncbi:TRAP transporter small permease [Lutispora saccharofermentans]|uniref:TRAP transporter small permease subunit n=1 Tax=Lutispora saccharofermentans TaxID=3024236 RepID=A0ABT1ND78_9FIRM|nr:TRAP transporter small permease [Lutispora saccharofermentans]MCQ1529208.1 TRAP transporter small permease subunit [Lutispora saccharofermentans]